MLTFKLNILKCRSSIHTHLKHRCCNPHLSIFGVYSWLHLASRCAYILNVHRYARSTWNAGQDWTRRSSSAYAAEAHDEAEISELG